jgi:hypothetical protein
VGAVGGNRCGVVGLDTKGVGDTWSQAGFSEAGSGGVMGIEDIVDVDVVADLASLGSTSIPLELDMVGRLNWCGEGGWVGWDGGGTSSWSGHCSRSGGLPLR